MPVTEQLVAKKKKTKFRSNAEAKFAEYLKNKRIFNLYEDTKIPYKVYEEKRYMPDFKIISAKEGKEIFLEVKGFFSPSDRKKMIFVKESNPELDIRFIFMYDNRINKNSNTRYSDWCKKHGFLYNIGLHLPKQWLDELS